MKNLNIRTKIKLRVKNEFIIIFRGFFGPKKGLPFVKAFNLHHVFLHMLSISCRISNCYQNLLLIASHPAFICSKLTIETLEQGVKPCSSVSIVNFEHVNFGWVLAFQAFSSGSLNLHIFLFCCT